MNAGQRDERRDADGGRSRASSWSPRSRVWRASSQSTPKKSPDRPQLMRRLAEGYVELESAAFRDKTEAGDRRPTRPRRKGSGNVAGLRERGRARPTRSSRPRVRRPSSTTPAQEPVPEVVPDQRRRPGQEHGLRDEVLYYLAYEYEQAARTSTTRARSTWSSSRAGRSRSTSPTPTSPSASSSSTRRRAIPASGRSPSSRTSEVIKYPPPDNKVWGYAHYKLGYVYWNKGDFAKALSEFKKTIEYGDAVRVSCPTPSSSQIGRAPRHDPGLRARRRSRSGLRLLQAALAATRAAATEKTFKHDGRPRAELPRHRPLPRGHRALPGPHEARSRATEVLRLPGPHHRGDAGDEVRQQGPSS